MNKSLTPTHKTLSHTTTFTPPHDDASASGTTTDTERQLAIAYERLTECAHERNLIGMKCYAACVVLVGVAK